MTLQEVEQAADHLDDALAGRSSAMRRALHEGATVADVARAARVTRQTVYRLTAENWRDEADRDEQSLDAGLAALLEHDALPLHLAGEVTKALGWPGKTRGDLLVKARRLVHAAKAAQVRSSTSTHELDAGLQVAGRLLGR